MAEDSNQAAMVEEVWRTHPTAGEPPPFKSFFWYNFSSSRGGARPWTCA